MGVDVDEARTHRESGSVEVSSRCRPGEIRDRGYDLAPDPYVLPFGGGAAPIEEGAAPHDEVEVAVLTRKSQKQGKSASSGEKTSAVHLFHFDIEFHNQTG